MIPTLVAFLAMQTWSVASQPLLVLSGTEHDFDRVRGAALLRDGRIAVADAGTSRVRLFSPRGAPVGAFGREGSGPREFQNLWHVQAFGDTVLVYDNGLQRVTLWRDTTLLETISLPSWQRRPFLLEAALSPHEYVGTTLEPSRARAGGLFIDTVTALRYDARTRSMQSLGRYGWRYLYRYPQRSGYSTYRTPFLPGAHLLAAGSAVAFVPMTGATVRVLDTAGTVHLPIPEQRFDRDRITAYRDSLLARSSVDAGAAQRLKDVFGRDFPAPRTAPQVSAAVAVGKHVWVRAESAPAARSVRWYVVDPNARRLQATIDLPTAWRVLGGDETRLLVLRRDEYDVESVAVLQVRR